MSGKRAGSESPLARPIDMSGSWNASDEEVAERFDPLYRQALPRLPDGDQVFLGLPFRLGSRSAGRRWLLLDRPLTINLRGYGPASHLVVAHFSDSWRDAAGDRPLGTPVGWVLTIGEPLACYELVAANASRWVVDVRRRFEVNDGIIGWGSLPFAALGHRADEVIDWRGPHPHQGMGRYASAGNAGPLTMLPGKWGSAQTGVADFFPTADDDGTYWLHSIPLHGAAEPAQLHLSPLGEGRPGSGVVVAALTLFAGTADPLVLGSRRQFSFEGFGDGLPEVDLGIAIRSRPLEGPTAGVPHIAGLRRGPGPAALRPRRRPRDPSGHRRDGALGAHHGRHRPPCRSASDGRAHRHECGDIARSHRSGVTGGFMK